MLKSKTIKGKLLNKDQSTFLKDTYFNKKYTKFLCQVFNDLSFE